MSILGLIFRLSEFDWLCSWGFTRAQWWLLKVKEHFINFLFCLYQRALHKYTYVHTLFVLNFILHMCAKYFGLKGKSIPHLVFYCLLCIQLDVREERILMLKDKYAGSIDVLENRKLYLLWKLSQLLSRNIPVKPLWWNVHCNGLIQCSTQRVTLDSLSICGACTIG